MIFADSRYNRYDKRSKLPRWIQQFLSDSSLSLSTDMALDVIRGFLRDMSQPVDSSRLRDMLLDAEKIGSAVPAGQGPSGAVAEPPPAPGAAAAAAAEASAASTVVPKAEPGLEEDGPEQQLSAGDDEQAPPKRPRVEFLS